MMTAKTLIYSLSLFFSAQAAFMPATALADASIQKKFTLVPGVSTDIFQATRTDTHVTITPPVTAPATVRCSVKTPEGTQALAQNSVIIRNGAKLTCTLAADAPQSTSLEVTFTVSLEPRTDLPELLALDEMRTQLTQPLFHTREFVDRVSTQFEKSIQEKTISLDSDTPEVTIEESAPANILFVVDHMTVHQEGIALVCDSRTHAGAEVFAVGNFASKTYRTKAPASRIACTATPSPQNQPKKAKKAKPTRPSITLKIRRFNLTAALEMILEQESKISAQAKTSALAQEKSEIAFIDSTSNRQIAENNYNNRLHLLQEQLHARNQELALKTQALAQMQADRNQAQQEQALAARLAVAKKLPKTALADSDWRLVLNHHQTEAQKARKRVEALNQNMQKAREAFAKYTQYSGIGYSPEKEMNAFAPDKRPLKSHLLNRHYLFQYVPIEIVEGDQTVLKTGLKIVKASQTLVEEHSQFTQLRSIPDSESLIVTSSNWPENSALSRKTLEIKACWNQEPNFKSVLSDLRKQRSAENLRPSLEESVLRLQASVQLQHSARGKKADPECTTPSPKDMIEVDLVRGPVAHFCYLAETREKNFDGYDRRNEIVLIPHRIQTEYHVYGNVQVIRYRDVTVKQMRNHEDILDSLKGSWNNLYASTLGDEKDKENHPFFKTSFNTGLEHHADLNTAGEICVPGLTGFPKYETSGGVLGAMDAYLSHAYGK